MGIDPGTNQTRGRFLARHFIAGIAGQMQARDGMQPLSRIFLDIGCSAGRTKSGRGPHRVQEKSHIVAGRFHHPSVMTRDHLLDRRAAPLERRGLVGSYQP